MFLNFIFIDSRKKLDYIGIVEDGFLKNFYIDNHDKKFKLGNIYRGRVSNIVEGINSAFITIGDEKNAYIHVSDVLPKEYMYEEGKHRIKDYLKIGEDIIVQIVKEGNGDKGHKVSRHINLSGQYIVLTPFSSKVSVSRKISNKEREDLLEKGNSVKLDNIGFIIRTGAKGASFKKIKEEYYFLMELYAYLEQQINYLPTPKLIYESEGIFEKILSRQDYVGYEIVVNNEGYFQELKKRKNLDRLVYNKNFKIDYNKIIMRDLKKALSQKIILKNSASIVIDELEAMTVIDVNSGGYTKGKNFDETILQVNKEASMEIFKQIQLRNLSGIILIDFIDFRSEKDKEKFIVSFKELFSKDRDINFIGLTQLGFVELTRKKTRDSDLRHFLNKCDSCNNFYKSLTLKD